MKEREEIKERILSLFEGDEEVEFFRIQTILKKKYVMGVMRLAGILNELIGDILIYQSSPDCFLKY